MLIFTLTMSFALLIQPLMMIYFGKCYNNNAPYTIDKTIGYRTKMSMINDDTWQFAHKYWGEISKKMGRYLLIVPIIPLIFHFAFLDNDMEHIGALGGLVIILITIEISSYFIAIHYTEKALKQTFDSNGLRLK